MTEFNFVLIHGTFASKATWINPESEFSLGLLKRFPKSEILSFRWSGRNDYAHRRMAAKQLRDALKIVEKKRKTILIAHSHGGTVALLAADMAPELVSNIVFLATPFIRMQPRRKNNISRNIQASIIWIILISISIYFISQIAWRAAAPEMMRMTELFRALGFFDQESRGSIYSSTRLWGDLGAAVIVESIGKWHVLNMITLWLPLIILAGSLSILFAYKVVKI